MRVFLSWSGEASKRAAVALRDWLPLVVQAVDPYMSAEDLEKGSRWSSEIATELERCDFGIICLTPENLETPWIQFEAGALSKSVDTGRVSPLLLALKPADVIGPLVQFQFTLPERDDVFRLVGAINAACGENGLSAERVARVFDALWPQLEDDLRVVTELAATAGGSAPKRALDDMLEELLGLVRNQTRLLADVPTRRHASSGESVRTAQEVRMEKLRSEAIRQILGGASNDVSVGVTDESILLFPRHPETDIPPDLFSAFESHPAFEGRTVRVVYRSTDEI